MRPPERFETERLVLRMPCMTDAEAIFDGYATDPEVTRYMTWRPHESIEDTRAFLEIAIADWSGDRSFGYAITMRGADECLGMVGLNLGDYNAEVGYVLAREYWCQGIVTEAAQALVEWAMAQPTIYRVWAICDVDNPASARVMEKVGMEREGILRRRIMHPNVSDEPRDCLCYSIVK